MVAGMTSCSRVCGTPAKSRVRSEFDLFRERQSIIDFDREVTNGALDLRVPEKQLDHSKITGLAVNLRHPGAAHGMGAIGAAVHAGGFDPAMQDAGVLARCCRTRRPLFHGTRGESVVDLIRVDMVQLHANRSRRTALVRRARDRNSTAHRTGIARQRGERVKSTRSCPSNRSYKRAGCARSDRSGNKLRTRPSDVRRIEAGRIWSVVVLI
jgi:hypothetical protein